MRVRVLCVCMGLDAWGGWVGVRTRVRVDVDVAVVVGAAPGAVVDEDCVATPAEAGSSPSEDAKGRADDDAGAKTDSGGDDEAGTRRVEDDGGTVDGHVEVGRVDGLNFEVAAVVTYVVVGVGVEVAIVVGGVALALDGVHNISALDEDRIAERARPLAVFSHRIEYGGKGQEGQNAGVPGKVVGLDGLGEGVAGEIRVLLGPGGGVGDLVPEGRCGEDLGQQGIRVQGDALNKLIELLRGHWGWRRGLLRVGRGRLLPVGWRGRGGSLVGLGLLLVGGGVWGDLLLIWGGLWRELADDRGLGEGDARESQENQC